MAHLVVSVSDVVVTHGGANDTLAWIIHDPHGGGRGLPYLAMEAIDVYASSTNSFSTAEKVGETTTNFFMHNGLLEESKYYYWLIPRDASGNLGARVPAGDEGLSHSVPGD